MSVYPNEKSALKHTNIRFIQNALYPCYVDTSTKRWINYGGHDYFDQPLCRMAALLRKYGFLWLDTIIFQHELGSLRATTEILDTRADPYSEKHFRRVRGFPIVGETHNVGRWYGQVHTNVFEAEPCSTVWYLDDGFFRPQSSSSKSKWHRLAWNKDWNLNVYEHWWTTQLDWIELNRMNYISHSDGTKWIVDETIPEKEFPHTSLGRWFVNVSPNSRATLSPEKKPRFSPPPSPKLETDEPRSPTYSPKSPDYEPTEPEYGPTSPSYSAISPPKSVSPKKKTLGSPKKPNKKKKL